jgi:hypothetical protein
MSRRRRSAGLALAGGLLVLFEVALSLLYLSREQVWFHVALIVLGLGAVALCWRSALGEFFRLNLPTRNTAARWGVPVAAALAFGATSALLARTAGYFLADRGSAHLLAIGLGAMALAISARNAELGERARSNP